MTKQRKKEELLVEQMQDTVAIQDEFLENKIKVGTFFKISVFSGLNNIFSIFKI